MSKPILFVLDDESDVRQALTDALKKRFGADYEVMGERLAVDGLRSLEELTTERREIALIIADHYLGEGMNGIEFLERASKSQPNARLLLLIDWLTTKPNADIARAMTLGELHYYLFKPWGKPEARLYPTVSELLSEWFRARRGMGWEVVTLIGDSRTSAMFELKQFLHRNNIPFNAYKPRTAKARGLLEEVLLTDADLPVAIRFDGKILKRPTKLDLAKAVAMETQADTGLHDVVIVGAGPAGLTAAVYGASEGLRVAVFEMESMGGQAGTTSLIKNYLGFPRGLSGSDLTKRATEQAWLFGATTIFGGEVVALESEAPFRRVVVKLSDGTKVKSRAAIISTGVNYNLLSADGIEALVGAGVFYGAALTEAATLRGKNVFVVGGGNSAAQVAIHFAQQGSNVTMVVRGESLAARMSDFLVKQIGKLKNVVIQTNATITSVRGDKYLEEVTLEVGDSRTIYSAQGLFILTGGKPHTEWLQNTLERRDGYILTGPDLLTDGKPVEAWPRDDRRPWTLETSVPGIFAAGDVRFGTAPRIAAAVGDGSLAIRLVHQYLKERDESDA